MFPLILLVALSGPVDRQSRVLSALDLDDTNQENGYISRTRRAPYGRPEIHAMDAKKLRSNPPLQLISCSPDHDTYQKWTHNQSSTLPTIYLTEKRGGNYYCIDISGFDTNVNATVYTWPCGQGGASTNEYWKVGTDFIQSMENPGQKCLGLYPGSQGVEGDYITTKVCDANDPGQKLRFDASGHIIHVPTGLCVDAGSISNLQYCNHLRQNWTFCNVSAPLDDRARDIVSRMSLSDKIQALGTGWPVLPSIGLQPYDWWSEATHGISHVNYDDKTPYASNTAMPITTARSFNRTLWHATGALIGREARAFENAGNAFSTYWAPVINIVRDPRWGRNIETAGEDPLVSGQYARHFVQGFQFAPEDPYALQASACCKHYIANELDGWNNTDRNHFDAAVTDQDLADSYLPPFQACVEQGRVSGLMCSYNAVNGVPSCANEWLLQTVARDTWLFDGYVTSDCDADADVYLSHHYTATAEEAVRDVLRAGTDVDCGTFVPEHAQAAYDQGLITDDDIDRALQRLFRLRLRTKLFDGVTALSTIGTDQICTPEAVEIARDGARQGSVLLSNRDNVLPLDAGKFKKAAVIGPNGDLSVDIAYYYGGQPCFYRYYTAVDAIQQYIDATTFVKGVPSVSSDDESNIPSAVQAAQAADVVFLVIGSDLSLEAEGHDRLEIGFSKGQLALIEAVSTNVSVPVIAIIMTGGALDVTPLLENEKIGAILEVGQPSVQVIGVGDVIFGKASPAGRMVQTTYPASFVDAVSLFDFNMRPGSSVWPPFSNPGRTYRFYTGPVVLPFGYGLSYTTFSYEIVEPSPTFLSIAPVRNILASYNGPSASTPRELLDPISGYYVNVTNTGNFDSDDVVLGFIVPEGAGKDGVPLQQLFGFQRVFVPKGQSVTVYIGVQGDAFTQVNARGVRVAWPGRYVVRFGVAETAKHAMGYVESELTVA